MRIEIVVFDGVDEMDVMGPFEVWSHAAKRTDLELALVGADGPQDVTGMNGLQFRAPGGLGTPDALFVPGGGWMNRAEHGSWAEARSGRLAERIAEVAPGLRWIGSVCTGSMLLAEAGLLKGRPATTNRSAWDELATHGVDVKQNRVVDDGDVLTSGGITAGIDLALYVVERQYGVQTADGIAATMEYTRDRDVLITQAV
ncbi:DJ-1/PfpI family protein [Kribbella sandramycini]|uniref:DJ-1/PfpI family protein n=1 Tax=Kribbella sandramycini TaxID=60450 RepID=A0A7Y4KZA4_9ACTN|nr:DJ-1/PfpI family protein [Kribbella sandramycini]MBB6565161.1 transcriptional regulator GlxA family with amidase domain [Kribbella sandramycini]NOL41430.1 DJ-1/PfpI family protein [Kribbella sandramycini]